GSIRRLGGGKRPFGDGPPPPGGGGGDLGAVSLTRTEAEPQTTQILKAPLVRGELTINLRAEADPEVLKRQVGAVLGNLGPVTAVGGEINAFRPGRPNPTHRMATSVANR
ncbi:MAG: hypothetical protein WCI73_11045, partial [Phycisphaerae bacterium]